MATITSVSYRRTFNLGNYESVTLEATAQVDETTDAVTALNDAQAFVMEQAGLKHHQALPAYPAAAPITYSRSAPPAPTDAPASDKQRSFVDYLLHDLNWGTEQLQAFTVEHGWNMLTLTKTEASALIDALKQVQRGETPGHAELPF